MIVYSKRIIQFINQIKIILKDILSREIGLRVSGDRFYDRRNQVSYPIKVVVFNNKSLLGYFDSYFYEIGFHERLMHSSNLQLRNVIRHELAHYITYINHGESVQSHGFEFRTFCRQMGWGEDVYKATSCLEDGLLISSNEESSVLRKVQKLMALAASSNKHEAEQAMIKSQQLLLKHNIESHGLTGANDDKIFLKRIMKQRRENAKMRSIANILGTFFVSTIYCRAGDFLYLEILGDAVNIEIAEYVAGVLDRKLDHLWEEARIQGGLKGLIAKNSFFRGIAKGYCNKIHALKKEYREETVSALMVIEKKLTDAEAMIYTRLSQTRSNANYCAKSSALGEQMGKALNINPALNKSEGNSMFLIGHTS